MKKTILVGVLASLPLFATAATISVCTGAAGPAANPITGDTSGNYFLRSNYTAQCSNNTIVTVDQNATSLWGGAGSKKGKNAFKGSTNGGAIVPNAACANTGCSDTEVNAAVTAAASMGASS